MKKKTFTMRMESALYAKLAKRAAADRRSVTAEIHALLEQALADLEKGVPQTEGREEKSWRQHR